MICRLVPLGGVREALTSFSEVPSGAGWRTGSPSATSRHHSVCSPQLRGVGGPARRRRGLSLLAAAIATSILALLAAEWADLQRRSQDRIAAEALGQELAARARVFDAWLNADEQDRSFSTGPGPGRIPWFRPTSRPETIPPTPREQAIVAIPAPDFLDMMDGVAEPWTNNSRPRLRVWDDPLAATIPGDWVLRYVVGWPDGADASRPGAGPPHGVIVATPDSSLETGEILRVRRSVLRRGGGPGVRAGRVPNNDLAATLARAGSIGPINAHTIFIPSWQFADIPRWLALRRPRAGFPPPGTDFGLGFGGTATATGAEAQGLESRGARIGGAVTIGSIPGAEPQWTDPGNPRLPTVFAETTPFSTLNGQDCADCGTITANEIILRGDARFANASAGGGIDGERVSVDGSVTTSRLQAGTMRVDGTWTGTSLNAETMDVGGTAIISGTLAIGERAGVTGSRATFSELDSGRIGINGQLTVQDTPDEIGLFSSDETSAAALTVTGPDARCIGCVPPPLQPGDPGYVPP